MKISHLQSGGECLRAYVAVAYNQIASWQDAEGRSGLKYAIEVVTRLLNPSTSEFTAAFVGRLVAILITKAGSALGDNSDMILRAVLSKMQQAETLSVTQVSRVGIEGVGICKITGLVAENVDWTELMLQDRIQNYEKVLTQFNLLFCKLFLFETAIRHIRED